MGSAAIFSGGYAKVLAANGIKLKDDTLVMHGSIDPTITNPSAPDGSVYLSDYGLFNRVGGVWVKLSDKIESFIKNSSFETDTSGWLTYADTASSSPADGVGGVAIVTIARSTTLPLSGVASGLFTKDAVNRQGQGFSYDFTIDNASKGKVLALRFDYQIASGTYANGDLSVWVYDVTNARMIQPAPTQIQNSGIIETFLGEFQSSIDSNSYRLIVHVSSTSASAYTVKFDNFYLGRAPKVYGSVTTDWVSYTATLTNLGNATQSMEYRRVGDSIEIKGRITIGSTLPTGTITVSLPSGLSAKALMFAGTTTASTGSPFFPIGTIEANGTNLTFLNVGTNSNWNATTPATWTPGQYFWINSIAIPVAGWSATQQLSSDADTRVVSFNAASLAPIAITNANAGVTKLVFTSVYDDSHGSYNSSTGDYTIKVPGVYQVYAKTYITMASGMQSLTVYKNGSREAYGTTTYGATTLESQVSWQGRLIAGDVISIRTTQTSGTGTATVGNGSSTGDIFFIGKLSGPSQIAASESVSARYKTSSAQVLPSAANTIIDFNTKEYDTHGAVTTGASWKFTAPMSGEYQIDTQVMYDTFSWTSGSYINLGINKNGVSYSKTPDSITQVAMSMYFSPPAVSTKVKLLQGEYISVDTNHNRGANCNLFPGATRNYITITRIGNY